MARFDADQTRMAFYVTCCGTVRCGVLLAMREAYGSVMTFFSRMGLLLVTVARSEKLNWFLSGRIPLE
jgi:hypothetical protein